VAAALPEIEAMFNKSISGSMILLKSEPVADSAFAVFELGYYLCVGADASGDYEVTT